MTETLVGMSPPSWKDPADPLSAEELATAKELVRQARAQGLALTGLAPFTGSRRDWLAGLRRASCGPVRL
jgi:hypothetical protein